MKYTMLTLLVLAVFASVIVAPASASTSISHKVINVNKYTQVIVDITQPTSSRLATTSTSTNGVWVPRDAKCVVKYWDDPWHKILDYQFTVKKHWEFNKTLNRVRRVQCDPGDCWINSTIRACGGWAETYGAMDYLYTLTGRDTGHYSLRKAKFHCQIGIKGFGLPIGTWKVNVEFRVFSKNRPGTNQNWRCDVTQSWRYGSGS